MKTDFVPWPSGCQDRNSCASHRRCMYLNCPHLNRDDLAAQMDLCDIITKDVTRGTVADISDTELLRRAVQNARATAPPKHPRRHGVMHAFALGSTYAAQLCRRFGFDPDEIVQR